MLTNNKKSFFVKGMALLMAMLMVLSVCLTGCGKAAEEAAKNAQDTADKAVADAAAAQTAADAVKKELEKYFTSEQTKTEAGKLIEAALAPYATTEALAAYVKSEDFNNLVAQLSGYAKTDAVNAAIEEALKGKVTATELEAIQKNLADSIKKNETAIADVVASLKGYATDAEIAAIQAALEKKIADGDAAVNNALKDYVKAAELTAVQKALNDKISASDKAIADAVASLKDYVKAEDYAYLVSSVQEMTFKLQTIDREHYGMVMETLAPYVENQEALAEAVKYLTDELAMIDKKHNDHIVELLADYVTTADYDALITRVRTLDEQLNELHMNALAEITALQGNLELLTAATQRLDAALEELHMNVKAEIADHDVKLDGLFGMIQQLSVDTTAMGKEIQGALANYATKVEVEALEGRLDKLEEVVRAILEAFYSEDLTDSTFVDLLDMPAATITTLIKDKMSLTEWNKTTPVVIETIESIQTLMSKIYNDSFTGLRDAYSVAAKKQINAYLAPLNIVMFDSNNQLTDYATNAKKLEYTILRVATLAELQALKKAIENANAVKTFADELKDLYEANLFSIGHTHTAVSDKKVQTVTIENKGQINAYADAYDKFIVKYIDEGSFKNTIYEYTYGAQKTMNVFTNGTTYVVTNATASYEVGDVTWTDTGINTILVGAEKSIWKDTDDYGLYYLPTDIVEYNWTAGSIVTGKVAGHYGDQDLNVAETYKDAEDTYAALIQQTKDAQDLVWAANATFKKFLEEVVQAYGTNTDAAGREIALSTIEFKNIKDAEFLAALTAGMCTPVDGEPAYSIYLTGAASVQTAYELALDRNTCENNAAHSSVLKNAMYRYDLYNQMIDKAWELTFELYRTYAYEMSLDILADYISALDYAIAYPTVAPKANELGNIDTFLADYDITVAGKLSTDFLKAFLNNDGSFTGWKSSDVETEAAITLKKSFKDQALVLYYGDLNNEAVKADPVATIAKYAGAMRQYLTSASVYPQLAIMNANMADYKNTGVTIASVFENILNTMVAGLDEVYNRFLLEDYKKIQLNAAWAYADETATLFCLDTDKAPLVSAMRDYLCAKVGGNNVLFQNLIMNEGDGFDGQLINGSMYTDLAAITVDAFAYIGVSAPVIDINDKNSDSYVNSATNKRVLAVQILGEYKIDLDNMAIKYNFAKYLDDATQNLVRAQLNYMKANNVNGNFVLTYDMINRLVAAHNGHNTAISIYKFQEEMGVIPFNEYINYYSEVLNLIASDKQLDHLDKLLGRSFDTYIDNGNGKFDAKIGLLSTTTKSWVNTALNNVVSSYDVLGSDLTYVGSAVREYDEIVNTNTKYYVNDTIANLY